MDWKQFVQFSLLGSSDLEHYAMLLVRVSLGLFFAISGADKIALRSKVLRVYAQHDLAALVRSAS